MKRHLAAFGLVALMAVAVTGCRRNDSCNLCPGYCDDSGCYACNSDDFCWPVDNPPCGAEASCAANEYCAEWGCARVCNFDVDCEQGERCLPAGHCGPEDDVSTPCAENTDCGNAMICVDGTCEEACQSDEDCPTDYWCSSCGECRPYGTGCGGTVTALCYVNEDCGAGKTCNAELQCAFTCDVNAPQCPHGQVCAQGECVDDPAPSEPECVQYNSECDSLPACQTRGCLCVGSYCQQLCETDADCGWGQFCNVGACRTDFRPEE